MGVSESGGREELWMMESYSFWVQALVQPIISKDNEFLHHPCSSSACMTLELATQKQTIKFL